MNVWKETTLWNRSNNLLVLDRCCLFPQCDHIITQSVVCIQRLTQDQLLNWPGKLDRCSVCELFWTLRTIGSSGSSCCSVCEIHWQIAFRGKSKATVSEPWAVHRNQDPDPCLPSACFVFSRCRLSTGGPGLKRTCGETLEKQKEPNYKQETAGRRARTGWMLFRGSSLQTHNMCGGGVETSVCGSEHRKLFCLFRRTSELTEPPSCR